MPKTQIDTSGLHPIHHTAQSLTQGLYEYLEKKGWGKYITVGQNDHDCICPNPQVEVVDLTNPRHMHVNFHIRPARQTLFITSNHPRIREAIQTWCQKMNLKLILKRT